MKKIFSFLVVCLLSCLTMGVWAQDVLPAKFSSADNSEEYWYNISFRRYTQQELYWLVDHGISGALINRVLDTNSPNFQWKFVLVPGSETQFYIVNRENGQYVSYVDAATAPNFVIDSYGMQVPPMPLKDWQGNDIINWDGQIRPTVNDSYVYYMDHNSYEYPSAFEFKWSPEQNGWGIIDPSITETTPTDGQLKQALNDWSAAGSIVAVWTLNDAGSIVNIDPAGVAVLTISTESLSIGSFVNKTSFSNTFTVNGRTLNGDITITKEGADADAFKVDVPASFSGGTVGVTFSPTEVRAYEATLRISSPGAEDKLVALTGDVYQESDLPNISSVDDSDEYWYYIQFPRRAPFVLAASDTDDPMVIQRDFSAGAADPKQMWKICHEPNSDGYVIVNKATGTELLYNTSPSYETINSNVVAGADRYILPESGYGTIFDFVRFGENGWQLRNRDVSGDSNVPERRYLNEWFEDGVSYYVHNWDKGDAGCEILFISADQPLIKTNVSVAAVSAPVGETKVTTVLVTGLATTNGITAAITGADAEKFSLSATTLPAEGGEIDITFTSDSETNFYRASLTLSSGTTEVVVPITGSYGGPIFSTPNQDVWHNIQFVRTGKAWQSNGPESPISQTALVEGDHKQQWKFTGTKDGFVIENREGELFFAYPKSPDGVVLDSYRATVAEEGDFARAVNNGDTWEFALVLDGQPGNRTGINDNNATAIGLWSLGDGGNPLIIIPVEAESVQRPGITVDALTNLASQAGEKVTADITVTGFNLTGEITASLSGEGAESYWLNTTTLPAAGGELEITFRPNSAKAYPATLTLSSAGMKDVTVPFAGLGAPRFSTTDNDIWYYIQFERNENLSDGGSKVWQWGGDYAMEVIQAEKEDDYNAQQWKFVGEWDSEFVIENREGGQIFFNKAENELGELYPEGKAYTEEEGDSFALVQNGTRWELRLAMFQDYQYNSPNDWENNGGNSGIGLWSAGDGGNFVKFIPLVPDPTNIKDLTIDADDQLVAKKFYTVQGIEVRQPAATGVYIVKKIYASGKTQVVKQLLIVK